MEGIYSEEDERIEVEGIYSEDEERIGRMWRGYTVRKKRG